MALIKCSECGKEISDKAACCIHCGCPIEKNEKTIIENDAYCFCNNCGKKISKTDKFCNYCGYSSNSKLTNCDVCGKSISTDAHLCPNCGNPIQEKRIENMSKKKWDELTDSEKKQISRYRKDTKQWWNYAGRLPLMIFIWVSYAFAMLFLFLFFPLFIFFILIELVLCIISFSISKNEPKQWYENHINELYKNKVLS